VEEQRDARKKKTDEGEEANPETMGIQRVL
jgi:hypothetical protein